MKNPTQSHDNIMSRDFSMENDRFGLKDLDEGREIRLLRKRPVWTAGSRTPANDYRAYVCGVAAM